MLSNMPSGQIKGFEYYTLEDIQSIIDNANNMEDPEWHVKISMVDIANLLQKYAMMLADYYWRYEDDGR